MFRKNLLSPSCRCSSSSAQVRTWQVRTFIFRFPWLGSSYSPPELYKEEDKVRASVWWDFETCGVPSGISYWNVARSIMATLRSNGIKGGIDIQAFGNVSQLSEIDQEKLTVNGIELRHIPARKRHILRYFLDWSSKNDPPTHLFIISGDRDPHFVRAVTDLRANDYNILLACPAKTSSVLCHTATKMWQWSSMLRGHFDGKHFGNPPSWYRDLNVPVEKPGLQYVVPKISQSVRIQKPSPEINFGEVPESVSKQVRKILSSYPDGISMVDLRAKLTKCDLPLDGCFDEHKEFPDFLVSIPRVQLLELEEGDFCVHLIPSDDDIFSESETGSDSDFEEWPPFDDFIPPTEEPTQNAEMLKHLKSCEVSKVTLENPFSAVEEPTSSKKQAC